MLNNLIDSAFLQEKEDEIFYNPFFIKINLKVDFDYAGIFYKEGEFEYLKCEFKKDDSSYNKIKIPVMIQELEVGHFIFKKKTMFTKDEILILEKECESFSENIKDFELSKIFKKQLNILQNGIIEKTNTTNKLKEKNDKLLKIDKAKNKYLMYITHELRTPLHSIIGFSTALRDEMLGSLNEKQKIYSNKILSLSIQLTGLINDLLDISKLDAGEMKVHLNKYRPEIIIKEVLNIIDPLLLEKNIKVEKNFNLEDEIFLDYVKFKQIIYNLLGNAIKFSHNNSIIKITTEKKENKAIIIIQDFGVGIDIKDKDKIFNRFVQINNKYANLYSSSGLGLAITKEFVNMQNGKIKVKSKINKGSSFILEFKI